MQQSARDERADYKLFIKQITLLKGKIFETILKQKFWAKLKAIEERVILFARDGN